jgi:hypothetical protein
MSILAGVNNIIEHHLGILHIGTTQPRSRHLSSCRELSSGKPTSFDPLQLIDTLYRQIDQNWLASGRDVSPSAENWRFEKKLHIADQNHSPEKTLEKAISRVMPESWVNQVPTASGLVNSTNDRHRNLDLVQRLAPRQFEFIELKVDSDNPLHAAMEILLYGVLYLLSRVIYTEAERAGRVLLCADTVHLRVLAPGSFYGPFNLGWLEQAITQGLNGVISKRPDLSLTMDFAFAAFPDRFAWPCSDDALAAAVERRGSVSWNGAR